MTSCVVVYRDSSSLACRNSYCVHHNVSNSFFPLTVFCTRYEIPQFLVYIISFERILKSRLEKLGKAWKRFVQLRSFIRIPKKHFYRLENPSKLPFSFPPLFQTIMDKSLGTLLHFWGVFQFTQVQPLPSPDKQCWRRVSRGADELIISYDLRVQDMLIVVDL